MAEAIASVIAIIQVADRIVGLCKYYIETTQDASRDLRNILIETSTLKTTLENLGFLTGFNNEVSTVVGTLSSEDGPIKGCHRSITELEKLFPSDCTLTRGQDRCKKQKLKATWAALAWPLKGNKARKLLDEIARFKTTITLAITTESMQDIKEIKTKTSGVYDILTDSQRREVYKWLQLTDPSPLHNRAQKLYEPGTGDWMLRSPKWASWLDARDRCLWIHGIPGAGKTVLMSHLIEQIKRHCDHKTQRKRAYVYYYCYFGHNQDETVPFLRWLIGQLCRQADSIPDVVYKMYKWGTEPSLIELLEAAGQMFELFEVTYIVIDAIDESSVPRDDLLNVLREFILSPWPKNPQLLVSSREYIDIERVMRQFSLSMPMANSLVEKDIRLHVRSVLRTSKKFKRWPQALLSEVEEAVSKGANGMFRWAVCQLDILQRLKCERHVVEKALKTLPKTLDETYDRILLAIPEEEQLSVHHALQWIRYHSDLYDGEGIPCKVLIQGLAKSTLKLCDEQDECLYDEETLRELCGCLINIAPDKVYHSEYTALTVTFAHYTVREYLDSTRITESSIAYAITCKQSLKQDLIEIVISSAYDIELNELRSYKYSLCAKDDIFLSLTEYFSLYCTISALLSLRKWPREISQQETLCSLGINLLNPAEPHFQILDCMAEEVNARLASSLNDEFWNIRGFSWITNRSKDPLDVDARHLFNLLLLAFKSGECLLFAERFLQGKNTKLFLQTRLKYRKRVFDEYLMLGYKQYYFDGTIIEYFAQCGSTKEIKLLLEYGKGFFDPSKILLFFIGRHNHDLHDGCEKYCLLERLVELGADPNMIGSRITPLQIAVISWDLHAVNVLLEAGADPNSTGDDDGIVWEGNTIMSQLNHLHGARPLAICRGFDCIHDPGLEKERKKDVSKIEDMLLQYQAKLSDIP